MIALICDQKLKEELSDFYHNIDDEVIHKLKDLCVIHDMTEDIICSQLLAFVMKYDRKELNLELIDDFETDYLNKKAINDLKKSKTLAAKSNKTPKSNSLNTGFKSNESIKALINEFTNESKPKPKLTTQVEIAISDESIEETNGICAETQDLEIQKTPEKETLKPSEDVIQQTDEEVMEVTEEGVQKTPEKLVDRKEWLDVSQMTTPVVELNDSINTSLKIEESVNSNILCYFGNSYSDYNWRNESKVKYTIEPFDKSIALTENYKFMSLKITESNEILNDIIDEFSEQLRQQLDIDSWGQLSVQSPTESYYIGRVSYEGNKTKLDEHSIRLESSAYISNNESIGLDLSRLSHYSVFAGQVIACKAINELGNTLLVKEMIDFDKIISLPKTVPTHTQPLNLVMAVGPFNSPQSLDFQPLKKLLKYVREYEPDFCILIGPFVDSLNDKLLTTDEPIERLFNTQMRYISEELMNVKTEAIVIPSTRDLNLMSVLPTMPFTSFKSTKIHYFSNPTLLNINGVIIGIISTDVLLHLSKEEISAGQNIDRLSRLCKHIINQKSFYPIFPPNVDINVEFPKYDFLRLPVSPHLLLLPSDLKEFVKNICGSVVINSGRISKSKFARIRVDSIDQKSFNGSLESYTNVEILKHNV